MYKVIQIRYNSSQSTRNMSEAIAFLLEIAKAVIFLFLYSYIHILDKLSMLV